jgi:hypothetical protein
VQPAFSRAEASIRNPALLLRANFRESLRLLKNSLCACSNPRSDTKHAVCGAFEARFVVAISSMLTFSTR